MCYTMTLDVLLIHIIYTTVHNLACLLPQGWGIVEFSAPEEAAAAIQQLDRSEVSQLCQLAP